MKKCVGSKEEESVSPLFKIIRADRAYCSFCRKPFPFRFYLKGGLGNAEEKAEQFRNALALPAPVPITDAPKAEHGGNSTENKYVAAMWYCEQAGKKFRDYMIVRQIATSG